MAAQLTTTEARNYDVNGETFDLIRLIEAIDLGARPDNWVHAESVNELKIGQIVHVWAMGAKLRRGVVTKLGRTKVTVVFTTQGAVDEATRYGTTIRVANTPVQLSQVWIEAAPVAPTFEEQVDEIVAELETEELEEQDVETEDTAALEAAENEGLAPAVESDEDSAPEPTPSPSRDTTGSGVVLLLEKVWARIREDHPELPDVVIVTGSGMIGPSRWGHFRANGWKTRAEGENAATNLRLGEMFMAGETLAKGARQVLQTMLHEAAHVMAKVRDIQDTSRQGRWHNAKFKDLAVELGLEHKRDQADKSHGFSFVTLTETTIARYTDLLDELDREIHLVVNLPIWLGGTEDDTEAEGGEKIGQGKKPGKGEGSTSNNLKCVCRCETPRIIRVSRKVLEEAGIMCRECGEDFEAA